MGKLHMGKIIGLYHVLKVDRISEPNKVKKGNVLINKIRGKVTQSNFLDEGFRYETPILTKAASLIAIGDFVKITFFTESENVEQMDDGAVHFKDRGVRYELWNFSNEGWDNLYEEYPADREKD